MSEIKGVFSISYGDPEHIVVIDDHKQPVCLNDEEQEFIDMVFSFLASRRTRFSTPCICNSALSSIVMIRSSFGI